MTLEELEDVIKWVNEYVQEIKWKRN
jgi:hypothetical protein